MMDSTCVRRPIAQRRILAVALLLLCPPRGLAAQTPEPGADERRAVLAAAERLFDAMRTRDTAVMRRVLHDRATLVGIRAAAGGGTRTQVLTAGEFIAFVARDTRAPWIERIWHPEVRIEGTLASVWAPYDFHFGTTFSHCGVDAMHLLKTADGWQITGIADTYQTAGCPARPAPRLP